MTEYDLINLAYLCMCTMKCCVARFKLKLGSYRNHCWTARHIQTTTDRTRIGSNPMYSSSLMYYDAGGRCRGGWRSISACVILCARWPCGVLDLVLRARVRFVRFALYADYVYVLHGIYTQNMWLMYDELSVCACVQYKQALSVCELWSCGNWTISHTERAVHILSSSDMCVCVCVWWFCCRSLAVEILWDYDANAQGVKTSMIWFALGYDIINDILIFPLRSTILSAFLTILICS